MKHALVLGVLGIAFAGCSSGTPARKPSQWVDEGKWTLKYRETFDGGKLATTPLAPNRLKEDDQYSDDGEFFRRTIAHFKAPRAYRAGFDFGQDGWLRLERYSRKQGRKASEQYQLVADPEDPKNRVLRVVSVDHTDGLVLRPSRALPPEYRVCVKGGHASFGDGKNSAAKNGYVGHEKAEPWLDMDAISQNGFYWLAILDAEPRPRNNVWIHHHRKAVIDSDSNWYAGENGTTTAWSRIYDGKRWPMSGERPVMMFVIDGRQDKKVWNSDLTGRPFISWSGGQWNSEVDTGEIRAADAYLDDVWYDTCIEKTKTHYKVAMKGRFRHGGDTAYAGEIERSRAWEIDGTPDYFMFGDPHVNFYRGSVHYDDIRLYVPAP